jgi:hypothetical protein
MSMSAQHVCVQSKKIRAKDHVPPTLLPTQWLLATPLKIAWMVQGARGRRQLPPPTPVDRRHYSMKTMSMEESRLQLSSLLGHVWQPLPQDDKGKEDLGTIKGGEATP